VRDGGRKGGREGGREGVRERDTWDTAGKGLGEVGGIHPLPYAALALSGSARSGFRV
jgi:hypothetical protein